MSDPVTAFLTGEDDDDAIEEIVDKLFRVHSNSSETQVCKLLDAWEASRYLHTNGFEILFEQSRPFTDWIDIFAAIDFVEAIPILNKVDQLVPEHVYLPEYTTESGVYIRAQFDELQACAYAFWDLDDVFLKRVRAYIREHSDLFFQKG